MKFELRNNQDFWAGVMFFGTGAGAMGIAWNYPFGSTLNMGPGYYPMVLGGLLIVMGGAVMLRGLRYNEKMQGPWSPRALVMLPLSVVAFGLLMSRAGFLPALAALVFLSAAAGREFKFTEVILLTLFLCVLAAVMFIWGLGLPYPLVRKF